MKHGDTVLLKRGKKRYSCTVVSDHTATFPAVTVLRGKDEWVVGINELLTKEDIERERAEKRRKDEESVQRVVDMFKQGRTTMRAIAEGLGKQMVDVLSQCRKAQRLGLIQLTKNNDPVKEQPTTPPAEQNIPGVC